MSRNGSMADQLAPLMAYRNRPRDDYEPMQTNWNRIVAKDNLDHGDDSQRSDIKDFHVERRINIRPTIGEIEREIVKADYREVAYCPSRTSKKGSRGKGEKSYPYPVSGDIEFGEHVDNSGKSHKVVTRIGKLRFSNGHATERAYKRGPDGKVVSYDATVPVGAMLGASEEQERVLGGNKKGVTTSNAYFAEILEANLPNKTKSIKRKPFTKTTKEEARADLAKAYANTLVLPPVTRCPPGLPWQPAAVAELFLGMKKLPKGDPGSLQWQDVSTAIADREVWEATLGALSQRDIETLDASMKARSFAEVGVKIGLSTFYADKRSGGKRALLAANDNLAAAIKKYAA